MVLRCERFEHGLFRRESNGQTSCHRGEIHHALGDFTLAVDPLQVAIAESRERRLNLVEWLNVQPHHNAHDGVHSLVANKAVNELATQRGDLTTFILAPFALDPALLERTERAGWGGPTRDHCRATRMAPRNHTPSRARARRN